MRILLIVATLLLMSIKANEYEVIVKQDSSQCYFNKDILTSNGFDQGEPTDYCYSNLGTISAKKDEYRDFDGNFAFRLTFYGQTGGIGYVPGQIALLWTQKQWIEESVVTDVDLSQIPQQAYNPSDGEYFHGLGINKAYPDASYLDGSPGDTHAHWFNAVLSFRVHVTGIPSFNGATATRNTLEILVPECSLDAIDICIRNEIEDVNRRVDTLRDFLKGADAAHTFNGDIFGDDRNVIGDSFEFTKTELLLLCMNILIIVFGLFICWRGGLFSKDNERKYTKVNYDVDKPINA